MGIRIRDAVHGDIEFTETEEYCMRTPVFQRLHRIKQLGNAFHAYPSAMHTRFEHSLGVCYQVKKIASSVNKRRSGAIDNAELLSLAGLLHDITHFPFKHTFERDSGLLIKEEPEVSYKRRFEQMKIDKKLNKEEIELLVQILSCTEAKDLDQPYQAQIIQDTFSADLLDYARRDTYFTGIKRDYDERIYDHIDIIHHEGKDFLGVNLTESGKNTASAITELINLLEVRYVLNERVYFYPAKIAADSLLIKGFRALSPSERDEFQAIIQDMSDELVVDFFVNSKNEQASFYGKRLKNRQLPRRAYTLKHSDFVKGSDYAKVITYFRGRSNADKWERCEADIAKEVGTDPRNIIIYCHDPGMQEKKEEVKKVLVWDESEKPYRLDQHERRDEVNLIATKHHNLWACYVFSIEERVIEKIGQVARGIMLRV